MSGDDIEALMFLVAEEMGNLQASIKEWEDPKWLNFDGAGLILAMKRSRYEAMERLYTELAAERLDALNRARSRSSSTPETHGDSAKPKER